jgi:hypothetical protein
MAHAAVAVTLWFPILLKISNAQRISGLNRTVIVSVRAI